MWIFSPVCDIINKSNIQESDIICYQHYRNDIYMRISNKSKNNDLIFAHNKLALLAVDFLYYIIIINYFDLDVDIKANIKLLCWNDELKTVGFV
jgi:hypothetical protein